MVEQVKRELRPGDTISCRGIKATIREVLSQHFSKIRGDVDIEFRDQRGAYRSWKSYSDGGNFIYYEDNFPKLNVIEYIDKYNYMGKWYDKNTRRFTIPVSIANSDSNVVNAILELMKTYGYFMTCSEELGKSYVLGEAGSDTNGIRNIFTCEETLKNRLSENNIDYFTKVSLRKYARDSRIGEVIDNVLLKGLEEKDNNWGIALIFNGKDFKFVEVFESFLR